MKTFSLFRQFGNSSNKHPRLLMVALEVFGQLIFRSLTIYSPSSYCNYMLLSILKFQRIFPG